MKGNVIQLHTLSIVEKMVCFQSSVQLDAKNNQKQKYVDEIGISWFIKTAQKKQYSGPGTWNS